MAHAGEWVDTKIDGSSSTDTDSPSDSGEALGAASTTVETRGSSASLLSSGELARLIVRGGAWSLFISASGAALSLGVHLALARILGAGDYGQYVYALAWMNVLVLVAKFELDTASVRFVGAYTATEEWSFLRGFLRRSTQIVGGVSVAMALVSGLVAFALMDRIGRGTALSFIAASVLLPVTAMGQLKASAIQGLKLVARAQAPNMVVRPIVFVLGILLVRYAFDQAVTAPIAILLQFAATTAALVLTIRFLQVVLPDAVQRASEAFDTRYWLRTAAGLLVISGGQIILSSNSDVLVVGSLLGPEFAGRYGVASQLAAAVSFGVTAISFIALPVVADLYAKQAFVKLQGLISHVARLGLALSVPVLFVLVLAAKPVLRAFGPSFADASGLLIGSPTRPVRDRPAAC
jgi:O-antigen/teichoic acid export membrane protein